MPRKFDHAMICVRNLTAAIEHYQQLGFEVLPGFHLVEMGLQNAFIFFQEHYLELLSIEHEETVKSLPFISKLFPLLAIHEGALAMYALATTDIQQEEKLLHQSPLPAAGPFVVRGTLPNGQHLQQRLLLPDLTTWCQTCPFFLQKKNLDERHPTQGPPGTHPNGAIGRQSIAVAVHGLDQMLELYQRWFSLPLVGKDELPALGAARATFRLGSFEMDLLAPSGEGPVQQFLTLYGEMPFELRLEVRDLEQARYYLSQHHLDYYSDPTYSGRILLPLAQTGGVRFVFMPQQERI